MRRGEREGTVQPRTGCAARSAAPRPARRLGSPRAVRTRLLSAHPEANVAVPAPCRPPSVHVTVACACPVIRDPYRHVHATIPRVSASCVHGDVELTHLRQDNVTLLFQAVRTWRVLSSLVDAERRGRQAGSRGVKLTWRSLGQISLALTPASPEAHDYSTPCPRRRQRGRHSARPVPSRRAPWCRSDRRSGPG